MLLGDDLKQTQAAHLLSLQRHWCGSLQSYTMQVSAISGSTTHWHFAAMLWCSRHVVTRRHQADPSSSLVRFAASSVRLLSVVHSAAERKWSTLLLTGTSYRCCGAVGMSLGDAIKQLQAAHLSNVQRQLCCSCLSARYNRSQVAARQFTGTFYQCFGAVGMSLGDVIKQIQAAHMSDLQRHWCGSFSRTQCSQAQVVDSTVH